jgi:hypothetical protein
MGITEALEICQRFGGFGGPARDIKAQLPRRGRRSTPRFGGAGSLVFHSRRFRFN